MHYSRWKLPLMNVCYNVNTMILFAQQNYWVNKRVRQSLQLVIVLSRVHFRLIAAISFQCSGPRCVRLAGVELFGNSLDNQNANKPSNIFHNTNSSSHLPTDYTTHTKDTHTQTQICTDLMSIHSTQVKINTPTLITHGSHRKKQQGTS